MPTLALDLTQPPADAVEFFDGKGNRLTWDWRDMLRQDHDLAFAVAKATSEEVLGTIRTQVATAIGQGMTFAEFKRTLKPQLQDLGWWGRQELLDGDTGEVTTVQLGSDRRLRTIYQTNLQTAYMAGRYQRMVGNATDRPYWRYVAIMDGRTRPRHRELHGRVFRWDDPIWKIIYPPNGFGCRCRVVAMTEDEFQGLGIELSNGEGMIVTKTVTMPDGRKVKVTGLKGILPGGGDFFPDVGWDYNPGDYRAAKTRLESVAEEKAAMAKRAKKAARAKVDATPPEPLKPAEPPPFDASTEAGTWHQPAWAGAPAWLRDVVLREQAVSVQRLDKNGAWAFVGRLIDMDGHSPTAARSQSTWRHEFGHILDYRLGQGKGYISSTDPFTSAADRDAAALTAAVVQRAQNMAAYASDAAQIAAAPERALLDACAAMGMTPDDLRRVMQSTPHDISAPATAWPTTLRRDVFIMVDALKARDVERFLRRAVGTTGAASRAAYAIDGALVSLADLVGALTRNAVCSPSMGYPGHSDAYYAGHSHRSATEAFANLTALAGHSAGWWKIVTHLMPNLAALYERTITAR
ncbi:hypothetical protein VITFI_CDS0609 [Vitreoscilla filiformis]|jgi:SPP1 gp7 family putative phage head morphogenesis protein|uniref:Phage head morphogenesis domain-containing protein n=1 Tax=Vitreoscilla filiformis TaxID=63 RepID=A0A221KBJ7_VITFI|nr:phage minor head protein [Vitreoscilla filiformis]ASM76388.1 hypothetical protein VITFI_CDS0609 [Vitreoscilla filiformis]